MTATQDHAREAGAKLHDIMSKVGVAPIKSSNVKAGVGVRMMIHATKQVAEMFHGNPVLVKFCYDLVPGKLAITVKEDPSGAIRWSPGQGGAFRLQATPSAVAGLGDSHKQFGVTAAEAVVMRRDNTLVITMPKNLNPKQEHRPKLHKNKKAKVGKETKAQARPSVADLKIAVADSGGSGDHGRPTADEPIAAKRDLRLVQTQQLPSADQSKSRFALSVKGSRLYVTEADAEPFRKTRWRVSNVERTVLGPLGVKVTLTRKNGKARLSVEPRGEFNWRVLTMYAPDARAEDVPDFGPSFIESITHEGDETVLILREPLKKPTPKSPSERKVVDEIADIPLEPLDPTTSAPRPRADFALPLLMRLKHTVGELNALIGEAVEQGDSVTVTFTDGKVKARYESDLG